MQKSTQMLFIEQHNGPCEQIVSPAQYQTFDFPSIFINGAKQRPIEKRALELGSAILLSLSVPICACHYFSNDF